MNIYTVETWSLLKVVLSKTPEQAIRKFIKFYGLPNEWTQRQEISVKYISYGFIE